MKIQTWILYFNDLRRENDLNVKFLARAKRAESSLPTEEGEKTPEKAETPVQALQRADSKSTEKDN